MCIRAFVAVMFLLLALVPAHAQEPQPAAPIPSAVPRMMWLSAVFRPTTMRPVAPEESVTVTIYRDREGGDALWRETQNVAMEPGGRYSVLMGSSDPDGLPVDLFTSGEPRWIGITFNRPGEVEQPRVPLASVPYALKAADADTLGGLPASAYLRAGPRASSSDVSRSSAASASQSLKGAASGDVSVATAGTPGYLGMFVDSTNLGNSLLFQNVTAGSIGLGNTMPRDMFHVTLNNGSGGITGYAVQNLSATANAYSGMLFYDQNGTLGLFQGFNNATHEYRINNVGSGGSINFRIAGASRFLVANNGNIGIGVPVPTSRLDAAGDINTTTQYRIGGNRVLSVPGNNTFAGVNAGELSTGNFNAFFGRIAGRNNTGSDNAFFGDGSGQFNSGSENAFLGKDAGFFNTSGTRNSFLGKAAGYANQQGFDNSAVGFQAGSSTINSCCNAYFGSFSGNNVSSGGHNTLIGYATELGLAALTNATALGAQAIVSQSNALVLGSINGQNFATADTSVGIGTASPATKLHLSGAGSNASGQTDLRVTGTGVVGSGITLESTGNGGRTYSWISTADNSGSGGLAAGRLAVLDVTAAAYRMVIDEEGRVGIGTPDPFSTLSVNGDAEKVGGGSWDVFSDERLKTIKSPFATGLDAVMQLQPIRYEYKPDNALGLKSTGEHIGFSAQAVQKVIPEAVTTNDRGYLLVNNDPILWTMLNAIQEQQREIEDQRRQNADLQRRLAALEAALTGRR